MEYSEERHRIIVEKEERAKKERRKKRNKDLVMRTILKEIGACPNGKKTFERSEFKNFTCVDLLKRMTAEALRETSSERRRKKIHSIEHLVIRFMTKEQRLEYASTIAQRTIKFINKFDENNKFSSIRDKVRQNMGVICDTDNSHDRKMFMGELSDYFGWASFRVTLAMTDKSFASIVKNKASLELTEQGIKILEEEEKKNKKKR